MITSTSNAQVKNIINLMKKSGERKRCGLFVIEGLKMFTEIPKDRIVKVYASESFAYDNKELLCNYEYEMVSDAVYKQMSDTKTPQGILATVRMLEYSLDDILPERRIPMVVVLENVQDPGNLGTIIRTAEGAGATGIIMSKDTVDIYNPKTIRSTMGSLFRLPVCDDLSYTETLSLLKDNGIATYASVIDTDACSVRDFDFPKNCAVVIGNEGNGLTNEEASMCDKRITIKMSGNINSLNAAMAAGIILWEMTK